MDMSQYRDLFISEAKEHLSGMGECIIRLESEPDEKDAIDSLFRSAHSVKGMASSMGFEPIAEIAHAMEDLMDKVRKGSMAFAATTADLFLEGVEALHEMIGDVENGGEGRTGKSNILGKIRSSVLEGGVPLPVSGKGDAPNVEAPPTPAATLPPEKEGRRRREQRQSVRVRTEVLDNLINVTGELVTTKHRLMKISEELDSPDLQDALNDLSRRLRELHLEVMRVRLMPFSAIAERFPEIVRQVARKGGKEVLLEIEGREVEIDRGILEQLADPLIHLLRNAVDHGLEAREERLSHGKPAAGRIRLEVRREKDQVLLSVMDDGKGMDPEKLLDSAVERNLIRPDQRNAISRRDAFMLTCIPGFSTAQRVTEISGRGVGMDVVRSSIQSLGGSLAIDSEVGKGTRIDLQVPVSVAIIQILLVRCAFLTIGFPIVRILRTVELARSDISSRGKRKVFYLDGEAIPLFSLNRLLGAPVLRPSGSCISIIVTELRGKKVGLVIDRFEGQQDVFLKPLGRPLDALRGAAGAAILGDGRVVVVLDPSGLV